MSTMAAVWHGTARFRPVLALVIILFVYFSVTQPAFATRTNIENLLTGISVLWIVSMGMTFVMLSGGADLSVGALAALDGILLAKTTHAGLPEAVCVLLAIAFALAIGAFVNGFLIGRLGLSFFVVTLASMTAMTGVVNVWSGGASYPVVSSFITNFALTKTLGLPNPIWAMIVTFVLSVYLLRYTYFGRDVYAVGGSMKAARLSGIRTDRILLIVYGIVGLSAALGGMVAISRIGVASPQVDNNLPLQAIAAVLLGGTALSGGAGSITGTALGTLFIGVLANGLSLSGVASYWQQIVTGVILVVAVLGDRLGLVNVRGLRRPSANSSPPPSAVSTAPNAETGSYTETDEDFNSAESSVSLSKHS